MKTENIFDQGLDLLKETSSKVTDTYEQHIRKEAIKKVKEKIDENNLTIDQIKKDDYEAMISDLSKDIKENYLKKTSQGLLAFVGLDFILGI